LWFVTGFHCGADRNVGVLNVSGLKDETLTPAPLPFS